MIRLYFESFLQIELDLLLNLAYYCTIKLKYD